MPIAAPAKRRKPVAALLIDLDVAKTHSRPHVPDDNPYSEAQFKTLKYRPDYPERFGSQPDARSWAQDFFHWYNDEHYHSALGLLTPAMVHYGLAPAVLAERQQALEEAYAAHPERFVKGRPQAGRLPEAVWINRPQPLLELTFAPDLSAHGRTTPGTLLSSASPLPPTVRADPDAAEVVRQCSAARRPEGARIPLADNASTAEQLDTKFLDELSQKY